MGAACLSGGSARRSAARLWFCAAVLAAAVASCAGEASAPAGRQQQVPPRTRAHTWPTGGGEEHPCTRTHAPPALAHAASLLCARTSSGSPPMVATGGDQSCAVEEGDAYCWGACAAHGACSHDGWSGRMAAGSVCTGARPPDAPPPTHTRRHRLHRQRRHVRRGQPQPPACSRGPQLDHSQRGGQLCVRAGGHQLLGWAVCACVRASSGCRRCSG